MLSCHCDYLMKAFFYLKGSSRSCFIQKVSSHKVGSASEFCALFFKDKMFFFKVLVVHCFAVAFFFLSFVSLIFVIHFDK